VQPAIQPVRRWRYLWQVEYQVVGGTEASQHGGIDRIGLDPPTGGLGKAAGLPGVDLDARQGGAGERFLQAPMVGPGGLEDDAGRMFGGDPDDQPGVTGVIVAELLDAALGVNMDIEMTLRDVDADSDLAC
jgi:hypothetical protein